MPADDLIGAVSRKREVARGEEENKGGQKKGDVSPIWKETLPKCWKVPSAASIADLPPTFTDPRRSVEGERRRRGRVLQPAAVDGAAQKPGWLS